MNPSEWTPERIAELSRLWDEGLSTSKIGLRLGITKNSVVGKVRRLDLTMRRAPAAKKPAATVLTLERLNPQMCSWPSGEPGDPSFSFCGHPAVEGKPYCEEHCARAYVRGSRDKKNQRAA